MKNEEGGSLRGNAFTPANRHLIERYATTKRVFHLRSPEEIKTCCAQHAL
ncbi:MAG TPA: hypothetical protein VF703_11795 [Pyrinomonadaceae bacterium]